MAQPGPRPRALIAWCLYDWANSAFPTVVATFVFAAYFAKAVAADEVGGTSQWGYAISASALAVAALSPPLGSIADRAGRRKPWLAAFTALCVAATALLWFIRPTPADALWALVLVAVANFAFETGSVFYNAMLPGLAPAARTGRLSGWGWGVGYIGGLACLTVALFGLVRASPPPFGLEAAAAEPVRATAVLVALWFGLFAVPLFVLVPDAPGRAIRAGQAVREGFKALAVTLTRVREHGPVVRFLVAHMIYTDGLNTLFAFGGIYAAGTFGLDYDEIIVFGIAVNVTAGLGAAAFAWIDDLIGPKRTVLIALAALTVLGAALVWVEGKALFWAFGLPLGIFVGPAQSASRSLMARLAPEDRSNEMFGLYALSGKATAFLGPALLAWVTAAMASQRWGMATILVFYVVGGAVLAGVAEPRR